MRPAVSDLSESNRVSAWTWIPGATIPASAKVPESEAEGVVVDLRHGINPESGEGVFEAANDALLRFPVESMCSEISR